MSEENKLSFQVEPSEAGQRIDRYLSEKLPDLTRSYLQKLIGEGFVLQKGKPVKNGTKTLAGEQIEVTVPEAEEPEILPEDIPLDILYEDADVILVNKPKDMVVHPAARPLQRHPGECSDVSLLDGLSGINGVLRPGIVHRIDKDTTGVLVVCKNDKAHNALAEQLKEHTITRRYRAIVCGNLKEDEGTVTRAFGTPSTGSEENGHSSARVADGP